MDGVLVPIIFFLVIGLVIISWFYFRFKEKQIMLDRGFTAEQMLLLLKMKPSKNLLLIAGIISIFFGIGLGIGIHVEEFYDYDAAVPFFLFVITGIGFVIAFFVDKKITEQSTTK